jgi:phage head maturation protease
MKGGSSHWINEQKLVPGRFSWGRGYGAFSVSESATTDVCAYIANQEEHHRTRGFGDELKLFVERYGMRWSGMETVETVSARQPWSSTPLKRGVIDRVARAFPTSSGVLK